MSGSDVIVVGGGVIGVATARALARDGLSVTLLERGDIGGGVSGASLACLGTHMIARDELPLLRWSCQAWSEVEEQTGRDCEYDRCGQLRFVADERDLCVAQGWVDSERSHGLAPELLDPQAVRELEPELRGPIVAATWSPDDAVINPFLACRALAADAVRHGAVLRTHTPVVALETHGEQVRGVRLADGSRLDGAHVVIAAGAWSGEMFERAGVPLPVRPRKAQCLATLARPRSIRRVVGACEAAEGVSPGYTQIQQARSGQVLFNTVLAGGLADSGAQDTSARVDRDFVRQSVDMLLWLFPGLQDATLLRSWVRFESVTPDDRFAIGQIGPRGLLVAAGCSGTGFVRAPAIGRMLLDRITGARTPFDCGMFNPHRFAEAS